MIKCDPENERIKRSYFAHLEGAHGLGEASLAVAAAAIHRFEQSTNFRSFRKFHLEQAIAFRRKMEDGVNARTGKPLSKATAAKTLSALREFFLFLAEQPGYRSRIRYSDAEYFRLSEKDSRAAKTANRRPIPTPEQIEAVLQRMPTDTVIERRNRAVIAFPWLTGVRDGALVTLKLKHVDLVAGAVNQDAREVRVKNSKSQYTTFFPVGGSARQIVVDWINELTTVHLFGADDPLFPATHMKLDEQLRFRADGICRKNWSNADRVRKVFRQAFQSIGLPAFHPHSVRHTLGMLAERNCTTPEQLKAWSQNLGHEDVLTTLTSYGEVPPDRQAEIMKSLGTSRPRSFEAREFVNEIADAVAARIGPNADRG